MIESRQVNAVDSNEPHNSRTIVIIQNAHEEGDEISTVRSHRKCQEHQSVDTYCLPFSQIVFLTQLFVILILDTFCLLKFSLTQQDSCQETAVHMGFLTSTLGYLIPPPRLSAEKYYKGKSSAKIRSSQAQSSLKDSTFDSNNGVDEIDCGLNEVKIDEAEPHTSVNKSCQEVITAADVNFGCVSDFWLVVICLFSSVRLFWYLFWFYLLLYDW